MIVFNIGYMGIAIGPLYQTQLENERNWYDTSVNKLEKKALQEPVKQ